MLLHALLQFLAVVVDELAGKDDESLLACLEALIEENGQLCRERGRRDLVELALRIVDDAGLGGIGSHILKIVALRDLLDLLPVRSLIGVVAGVDDGDDSLAVDLLAVLGAAEVQGIETFLIVHEFRKPLGNGLNQSDLAVPANFLVGHIEPVIHERAEEITLAELKHLHRCLLKDVAIIAGLLQNIII